MLPGIFTLFDRQVQQQLLILHIQNANNTMMAAYGRGAFPPLLAPLITCIHAFVKSLMCNLNKNKKRQL